MKKNIFKKSIALLLSVVLCLQMSCIGAFAALTAEITTQNEAEAMKYAVGHYFSDSHSLDAGRAGTVRFADYTLEASAEFVIPEAYTGMFAPAEQSLVYGGYAQAFLENIAETPCASVGGWIMPILSFVCEVTEGDDEFIVWFDRFGETHSFHPSAELTQSVNAEPGARICEGYICGGEPDGFILLKYTGAPDPNEPDPIVAAARYFILAFSFDDEAQIPVQAYYFDDDGRIVRSADLSDSYISSITYVENGAFDQISTVSDPLGNEYRYTYTNGLLTGIKCYDAENNPVSFSTAQNAPALETRFEYTDGKLTKVVYPDSEFVTYAYDTAGRLTEAVNIDGVKIVLAYNVNGYVSSMARLAPDGNDGYETLNSVTVTVPELNVRRFVYENGDVIIKTYDANGNILTIYDGDGNCLLDNTVTPEEPTTEPSEPLTEPAEPVTEPAEPVEPTTEVFDFPVYRYGCDCCPDCEEFNCACDCPSEAECDCPQCKRYHEEVTTDFGDIVNVVEEIAFDGVRSMSELSSYTADGAFLTQTIDSAGNIVYYDYNNAGLLTALTAGDPANGSVVEFGYDAMGNLISLAQDVSGLAGGATEMKNEYGYTDDRLTSITHNGFSYVFTYDTFGNVTEIEILDPSVPNDPDAVSLTEYSYTTEAENAPVASISYANGQSVAYTYNNDGEIVSVAYDGAASPRFTYHYDEDGVLTAVVDTAAGQVAEYADDGFDLYEYPRTTGDEPLFSVSTNDETGAVTYTSCGHAITVTEQTEYSPVTGATSETVVYDGEIDSAWYRDTLTSETDWFGRTTTKSVSVQSGLIGSNRVAEGDGGAYAYTYFDTASTASPQVRSLAYGYSSQTVERDYENFFTYDDRGNLTGVYQLDNNDIPVYSHKYYYDEANQLVREDYAAGDKTVVYQYDAGGNLTKRSLYPLTFADEITAQPTRVFNYGYSSGTWRDVLTSCDGKTVTSDAAGNITAIGQDVTLTWTAGRQLATSTDANEKTLYYYNSDGFISKTQTWNAAGTELRRTNEFFWQDGVLLAQRQTEADSGESTVYEYLYDADGELQAIAFDGFRWTLEKNLLGDVVGVNLVNAGLPDQPMRVADIDYDAYGAPTFSNAGNQGLLAALYVSLNPILYRGYLGISVGGVFCYYLGSRFYSPELGRFLNADVYQDTQQGVVGTNMFAYCNNNPITMIDPEGKAAQTKINAIQLNYITTMLKIYSLNLLCARLLLWSITHRKTGMTYDFSGKTDYGQNWSKLIIKKLKYSQYMNGIYATSIILMAITKKKILQVSIGPNQKAGRGFYEYGDNPTLTDKDLAWSIGGISGYFTIIIKQLQDSIKVIVFLSQELWDFKNWKEDKNASNDGFTRFLNNFGDILQKSNAVVPYYWGFTVSFNL
ncbi:MAG: RHS repeat protein [Clostridia bacterium]|nr:RHS repeat protein [Clostridia bacterium]